jgi:hypothetical protein
LFYLELLAWRRELNPGAGLTDLGVWFGEEKWNEIDFVPGFPQNRGRKEENRGTKPEEKR